MPRSARAAMAPRARAAAPIGWWAATKATASRTRLIRSSIRTVGSYWPYATTLYDYTARAMPFQRPGTLTANETYGLVAYLLFQNGIVKEDAVMDQATLPKVVMPARDKFVPDNRTGGKVVK